MKKRLYLTMLACLSFALFCPAQPASENLIQNGDFEDGSTKWRGDKNVEPESPDEANKICRIMADEGGTVEFYQPMKTEGMDKIQIRFRVRKSADHSGTDWFVGLRDDGSTGTRNMRSQLRNNDWNEIEYIMSLNPDCSRTELIIQVRPGKGYVCFDDFEVVEHIDLSVKSPAVTEDEPVDDDGVNDYEAKEEDVDDGYRIFTDSNGREIEAKVVTYSAASDTLRLKRADGKTFQISPTSFSVDDQGYIQEWIAADQFLSDKTLEISFKKNREPADEKAAVGKPGFDGELVDFEITLENRSEEPIVDIEVDYSFFIEDSRQAGFRQILHRGKKIDMIAAASSVIYMTESVKIGNSVSLVSVHDSQTGNFQGYDERITSRENLEGIWIRLYGPELDGKRVYRDICHPSRLDKNVTWDEDQ